MKSLNFQGETARNSRHCSSPVTLRFLLQPELGVSPAEQVPVSFLSGLNKLEQKRRDETRYLSSSEMYRVRCIPVCGDQLQGKL